MKKVYWISRHELTYAQRETISKLYEGFDIEAEKIEKLEIVFNKEPAKQLAEQGITKEDMVLGVFPQHILIQLLKEGFQLGGFINSSSARNKGTFLCEGMFASYISGSSLEYNYIECPVPTEEQEPSGLTPLGR